MFLNQQKKNFINTYVNALNNWRKKNVFLLRFQHNGKNPLKNNNKDTIWIKFKPFTGQSFEIKSHFMDGDAMFTWSHASKYHDVSVTCDGRHLGFTRVYDNKFVLKDVLNCKIVNILVRATIHYSYIESRTTFQRKFSARYFFTSFSSLLKISLIV